MNEFISYANYNKTQYLTQYNWKKRKKLSYNRQNTVTLGVYKLTIIYLVLDFAKKLLNVLTNNWSKTYRS